jgi:hypothetical protein
LWEQTLLLCVNLAKLEHSVVILLVQFVIPEAGQTLAHLLVPVVCQEHFLNHMELIHQLLVKNVLLEPIRTHMRLNAMSAIQEPFQI